MKILFYYPFNKRTIPIDVPLFALRDRGHEIILLTLAEKGSLHQLYEAHGISTYTHRHQNRFRQLLELISFCRKHNVDIIHSHLQQTNLIASVASKLMTSTRVMLFRHHCKFHYLVNDPTLRVPKKELWADRIINRLASRIIVPSTGVRNAMTNHEGVPARKIMVLPYMYHFDQMSAISRDRVEQIKGQFPSKFRLIMISRLTPFKRHLVALKAVLPLLREDLDFQLLILDDGPELDRLKEYVKEQDCESRVHFLGFQSNPLEYLAASDFLLHPSLTDASNSAVKEAGLFEKIVLVCDQVGDFNDYIINNENGYLIGAESFEQECRSILSDLLRDKKSNQLGNRLKQAVLSKFAFSESVVDQYESL